MKDIQIIYQDETGNAPEYLVHMSYYESEYVEWLEDRLKIANEKIRQYEDFILKNNITTSKCI